MIVSRHLFIVSAFYDRILLANFHALHHKSRHAIFITYRLPQELLNMLRNYSDELTTKVTGVET